MTRFWLPFAAMVYSSVLTVWLARDAGGHPLFVVPPVLCFACVLGWRSRAVQAVAAFVILICCVLVVTFFPAAVLLLIGCLYQEPPKKEPAEPDSIIVRENECRGD